MSRTPGRGVPAGNPGERGFAIVIALIALFMLTMLGLMSSSMGTLQVSISNNERETTRAYYIAESGLTHARSILFTQDRDFDDYLQAGDGVACTGDELSDPPSAPLAAGDEIASAASGGESFGSGGYRVFLCDDDDGDGDPDSDANDRVLIMANGLGESGASAFVELLMLNTPLPAVVANGNIRISGNPDILGTEGSVHANGNLEMNGNPCAEQHFSSSGSVASTGNPKTGSQCAGSGSYDSPTDARPASDLVTVPDLNPADFKSEADYILGSDGSVEDGAGNVLKAPGPGNWGKWDWNPDNLEWKLSGDPVLPGTYYSEGSIAVSGNPGSPGSPAPLSLVAEGWVKISGNPDFTPTLSLSGVSYMVIAGTDLQISGNPENAAGGVWYARHQFGVSGNPTIQGQVVAFNGADTHFPDPGGTNLVPLQNGQMVISGNPTITYSAGSALMNLAVGGWRECRGSNPDNPCL